MARGVNKVILVGNLGNDPEVRQTPNGSTVSTLSVATSESWRDRQSGNMVEKTEWHRVVIFGKLAEIAGQYLRKGSKVYLEGKLQTNKWQDKQGQDRYTTEIVLDINGQMQMLDRRDESSGSDFQPQAVRGNFDGQPTQFQHTGSPAFQKPVPTENFGRQPAGEKPQQKPAAPEPATTPSGFDNFDDDIPF